MTLKSELTGYCGERICMFEDGWKSAEMSLSEQEGTDTVCISTHHRCNMGCKTCQFTEEWKNNTSVPVQYRDFAYCLALTTCEPMVYDLFGNLDECKTVAGPRITDNKTLVLSFAGMGEPLFNIPLIREAARLIKYIKRFLHYENVEIRMSTVLPEASLHRVTDIALKYCTSIRVSLMLHSALDNKRRNMVPFQGIPVLSVEKCFKSIRMHMDKLSADVNIINQYNRTDAGNIMSDVWYLLMEGINDSKKELSELQWLAKKYSIPVTLACMKEKPETTKKAEIWKRSLLEDGIKACIFHVYGGAPFCSLPLPNSEGG